MGRSPCVWAPSSISALFNTKALSPSVSSLKPRSKVVPAGASYSMKTRPSCLPPKSYSRAVPAESATVIFLIWEGKKGCFVPNDRQAMFSTGLAWGLRRGCGCQPCVLVDDASFAPTSRLFSAAAVVGFAQNRGRRKGQRIVGFFDGRKQQNPPPWELKGKTPRPQMWAFRSRPTDSSLRVNSSGKAASWRGPIGVGRARDRPPPAFYH